jgi:aldehyde dehydrogenase (NAD+)
MRSRVASIMAIDGAAPYGLFIGGQEIPGSRGERRTLLNPATNQPLAETAVASVEDARQAMEAADTSFRSSNWATDDGSRRGRALYRLAQLLEQNLESFARLETLNMGKTLKESRVDIGFTVRTFEYFAGLADKVQGETIPVPGSRFDYTIREPLGVTVHIAPWNYPLLLACRSIAPALAAGNAVVLKPASLTPLTALSLARLAQPAGLPDGILNVVVGSGAAIGEALITDSRCRSVSFTGSSEVGQRIAELAAHRLVPATLELGGKSPVIVFPDADLDRAARGISLGIFGNAGQMCWAASRLIVAESVKAPLLEKVTAAANGLKLGPGTNEGIDMGPLVSRDQADRVRGYIDAAEPEGGTILCGGSPLTDPSLREGNFVRPTVIGDLPSSSRVIQEEIFGPVLAVQSFASTDAAIALANDTRYGLFASVWTKDLGTAHSVARQLQAGMVSINEPPTTFPQSPFGGYKESGLGFEQGVHAIEAYTRRKNVLINLGGAKRKA